MSHIYKMPESSFMFLMQGFCTQLDWHLADLNEQRALLKFTTSSGCFQNLFIVRYSTTLEFSAPLAKYFDSLENIPHQLSTSLLRRNAENKIGFWCLEMVSLHPTYTCMHNIDLSQISIERFEDVAQFLVRECQEVGEIMKDIESPNSFSYSQ